MSIDTCSKYSCCKGKESLGLVQRVNEGEYSVKAGFFKTNNITF